MLLLNIDFQIRILLVLKIHSYISIITEVLFILIEFNSINKMLLHLKAVEIFFLAEIFHGRIHHIIIVELVVIQTAIEENPRLRVLFLKLLLAGLDLQQFVEGPNSIDSYIIIRKIILLHLT